MKVPVILGPTGVGKSRAAFEVARALEGEIIVCDSRQVYDRLDIATNKPSPQEMRSVPYHLVGIADPTRLFTVFDFVQAATAALAQIAARGRLAIVEGGSMLWTDALLDGFSLGGVARRPDRRAELELLPLEQLVALLRSLDPTARLDERNRPRLVRAIELLEVAGPPLDRLRQRAAPAWTPIRSAR